MEKVAVVVPVYNSADLLPRCLDSLANQTYSDFIAILVDDGSTDSSGAICEKYTQKDVRFVTIRKENGGVSSARNAGLKRINEIGGGIKYVSFVDSDDYLDCTFLEKLIALCENTDADIAVCQYDLVKNEEVISAGQGIKSDYPFIKDSMLYYWQFPHITKYIRGSLKTQVRILDS